MKRIIIISLLIISLLSLFFQNCKSKVDYQFNNTNWHRFRGPNGDSISLETGWNPKAIMKKSNLKWKIAVGKGYSSIAIKDDYLFTVGLSKKDEDTVYCINIDDRHIIWEYTYPVKPINYNGPRATPFIDNNYLYTLSSNGHVFCLNISDGKLIWKKDLIKDFNAKMPIQGFAGSPVIDGNLLILNACSNGIALNKNTGDSIWISTPGVCGYATPVIFDYNSKRYTAIFSSESLYIVEVNTGRIISYYDWATSYNENSADPIIKDNKIFISSAHNKGCALFELKDNKLELIWKNKELKNRFSSNILVDNLIYGYDGHGNTPGGSFGGSIKCIDFNSGDVLFIKKSDLSSMIFSDDKLIIIAEKGKLSIIDISNNQFNELSSIDLKRDIYWTAPVLCRGNLYIRNQSGDLYCFDMR